MGLSLMKSFALGGKEWGLLLRRSGQRLARLEFPAGPSTRHGASAAGEPSVQGKPGPVRLAAKPVGVSREPTGWGWVGPWLLTQPRRR